MYPIGASALTLMPTQLWILVDSGSLSAA